MQTRVAQVLSLFAVLVLSIILLIMSSKYAAWAREMTKAAGNWLNLCFYVGSIPLISLVYSTSHLAALQFNGLPVPPYPNTRTSALVPNPRNRQSKTNSYDPDYASSTTFFILVISVLHFIAWFVQSILCTSCELAPILSGAQGRVPAWCPQSRFQDTGNANLADMLGKLATAKDILQWGMVGLTVALIEIARREWMRAERVRSETLRAQGAGIDFGGERRQIDLKTGVELVGMQISGPQPIQPASVQQPLPESEAKHKRSGQGSLGEPGPPIPRQPEGPGVPDGKNTDNYYGNGMKAGLKRTGTLNYMYDTRV